MTLDPNGTCHDCGRALSVVGIRLRALYCRTHVAKHRTPVKVRKQPAHRWPSKTRFANRMTDLYGLAYPVHERIP